MLEMIEFFLPPSLFRVYMCKKAVDREQKMSKEYEKEKTK
jgi:hypothetical protein